jgi:hypothetical protein
LRLIRRIMFTHGVPVLKINLSTLTDFCEFFDSFGTCQGDATDNHVVTPFCVIVKKIPSVLFCMRSCTVNSLLITGVRQVLLARPY